MGRHRGTKAQRHEVKAVVADGPPSVPLCLPIPWPGGRMEKAAGCNPVHAGSIPVPVLFWKVKSANGAAPVLKTGGA